VSGITAMVARQQECRGRHSCFEVLWEYAGHLAVEAIDDKVMRDFIPWRRDYYANFDITEERQAASTDKTFQWDTMLGKPSSNGLPSKDYGESSLLSL
jgi:hypothetical protein